MPKPLIKGSYFLTAESRVWLHEQADQRRHAGVSASSLVRLAVAKLSDEVKAGLDLDAELAAFGEPKQENGG